VSPLTEYMLQTALTLGGIAALGYLLVYTVRRADRGLPKGPLELLATLRLEQRRSLYLVRIAERTVVLGASEGGMVTVLELDKAELATVTPTPRRATFADVWSRVLTSNHPSKPSPPAAHPSEQEHSEPDARP
jgi:flagellar biogenesis protein FliO